MNFTNITNWKARQSGLVYLTIIFIITITGVKLSAATIYVDASKGLTAGNGTSWANAYGDLQKALNTASPTDEIWVRAGIYASLNHQFIYDEPTSAKSLTFTIWKNVQLYGGFDGTETSLSQRDPVANPTILSGVDPPGTTGGTSRYHTLMIDGRVTGTGGTAITPQCIIDGFIMEKANGQFSPTPQNRRGAGIFLHGKGTGAVASPTIRNCIIRDNRCSEGGTAIYMEADFGGPGDCDPTFINCLFYGNWDLGSLGNEGVIRGDESSPEFINCTSAGNRFGDIKYAFKGGFVAFKNCILGDGFDSNPIATSGIVGITTSLVRGAGSAALIDADPQFNQDFTLDPCSPAIDVGEDSFISTTTDLAGNARKVGTIDLGCYEYQGDQGPCIIGCPAMDNPALGFDGVDDHINVGPDVGNFGTEDFTIELWLKTDYVPTGAETYVTIASKRGTCNCDNQWEIDYDIGGLPYFGMISDQSCTVNLRHDGTTVVNDGEWHHLAYVREGSNHKLYVDGVVESDQTRSIIGIDNTSDLLIGKGVCSDFNFAGHFNGAIDEFRIWSRARSAQDLEDYRYTELDGTEYGLALYYNMNEGTPDGDNSLVNVVLDQSGRGASKSPINFTKTGSVSNWVASRPIIHQDANANGTPDICEYDCTPLIINQWAVSATASSYYTPVPGWDPDQAAGPPDLNVCGDLTGSWAPFANGDDPEWLRVVYDMPVRPIMIRVHETYSAPFIYRVELVDVHGIVHNIWEGTDMTSCNDYFELSIAPPSYLVKEVILHTQVDNYEEIDAVQLVGIRADDLVLDDDPITADSYYGAEITSSGVVANSTTVQMVAEYTASLLPDFETENGGLLEVSIGNCTED